MSNYETWQLEKYGNILKENSNISYESEDERLSQIQINNIEFSQQNPK